jgi:SAM-dependent methyltransferase
VESDKAICQSTTFECANITSLNIPREAYDLILSIGTLGELCPLTKELIGKVVAGLRPGGIFLFTVFDAGHKNGTMVRSTLSKEPFVRLSSKLYPVMPGKLKRPYGRWFFSHYLTMRDLQQLLSGFEVNKPLVKRLRSPKDEWDGTHLVVLMHRPTSPDRDVSGLLESAWEIGARNMNGDRKNIL